MGKTEMRTGKTYPWMQPTSSALIDLWENSSDALFISDPDLSDIHLNPAAIALVSQFSIDDRQIAAVQTARSLLDGIKQRGLFETPGATIHEIPFRSRHLAVTVCALDEPNYLIICRKLSRTKPLKAQLKDLEDTNSELNEIIELSADGLVSVDQTGVIIRLNDAYKQILGITDEQFIGTPAQSLVDKGYLPELVSPKVFKHRKPMDIMVTIKGKDVLLTGRPVFNEFGQVVRVVANIRDLTKLNRLKEKLNRYHDLASRYETEISHLRSRKIDTKIVGRSDGALKMMALAAQAAQVDSTVLVFGETGTGKELLVKSIHELSSKGDGPFIAVNCSSIPESLMESELFGYEAGAFTGSSRKGKVGLFEAADKGTLFLDEISEMPLSMQAKLLRVIQEKKVVRIGSSKANPIDTRIIAASNERLETCVEAGTFRADLYYRLNIINIDIPPLRERKEDIPLLADQFLNYFNKKFNRNKVISEKESVMLVAYDWPGNIRELRNTIERFVVLENAITIERQLYKYKRHSVYRNDPQQPVTCLRSHLKKMEHDIILRTYKKFKSTRKTAAALNVSQSTIARKIKHCR